ncbi:MAG: adenylosuccinate lyase [Candidatus Hepatoplasma vulgare]|nr:MAG: adenylosuccinate lyase [Candidatus Hepatoplasma sp.]
MQKIWSQENKFQKFLDVELEVIHSFVKIKVIPIKDYEILKENAKINLKEIEEIEKITKHDVVAFTRSISKKLGDEKKWIHYKLTASDVIDTANALLIKEANNEIEKELLIFLEVLKENANKYKNTPIIGRTHGIHGEPTSFGLKWLLWYDEMSRNIKRFKNAREEIETGKISGSMGNFANIKSNIQDMVCSNLKINSAKISTQIIQRDVYANYIHSIAMIGNSLEKIAIEIRTLQRTEIGEVQEYFSTGQKGSSSMPHKKNPITSENITGISRILRGYVFSAYENIPLWNERDISHSSVERVIIPDATTLIQYALKRYSYTLKTLIVNEKKMFENIWITKGLVFSQRILSNLIKKEYSREKAYDLIQNLALKSMKENKDFKNLILENNEINKLFNKDEINNFFDYKYYLREVDNIYKRVF